MTDGIKDGGAALKYALGQEVWWAQFGREETTIKCPDCCGSGYITCIMGDGTRVTVDCQNCNRGFEPFSRGYLTIYDRAPTAVKTTIIGMDVNTNQVRYRVPQSYIVDECDLFETEAEALARAKERAEQASAEELERIQKKEKNTRSWSWNATYHRRCIRDAEKKIEYHTKKLDVAAAKASINKAREGR